MKVKNIVFSGFAAAILMGAVEANATTPFKIASQAYVDREVASVASDVSTLSDTVSGLTSGNNSVASQIESVVGDLTDATNGLSGFESGTDTVVEALNELKGDVTSAASAASDAQDDVDALEAIVGSGFSSTQGETVADAVAAAATAASNAGTAASAAQDDVDALEAAVGSGFSAQNTVAAAIDAKQNKLGGTNDAGKVVTATATAGDVTYTAIDTTIGAQGTSNLITSAAVKAYVDNAIDGVSGTTGSIATQIGTALGDLGTGNTTVEDALADKQDNLSQTELDSITAAAALLAAGYNTCISQANGSGHCVLSASSTGLEWIDVTSPFEIQ